MSTGRRQALLEGLDLLLSSRHMALISVLTHLRGNHLLLCRVLCVVGLLLRVLLAAVKMQVRPLPQAEGLRAMLLTCRVRHLVLRLLHCWYCICSVRTMQTDYEFEF